MRKALIASAIFLIPNIPLADSIIKSSPFKKEQGTPQGTSTSVVNTHKSVHVIKALFCSGVTDRKPSGVGEEFPSNIGTVYFFTQIKYEDWNDENRTHIIHNWYFKNERVASIRLDVAGSLWRTYSYKTIPISAIGPWRAEVVDAEGNILDTKVFSIIEQGT